MIRLHWKLIALSIGILILFSGIRLYRTDTTLFFHGDYVRDYLVLHDWLATKKPPLLGPQTSALPYNQSAIYFYLLMPLYLLTNHSPLASVYTVVLVHAIAFLGGVYLLRKTNLLYPFILSFLLLSIHPQFILQHRIVWNPSFVGISILLGTFNLLWFEHVRRKLLLVGSVFFFSLATAFSYSAVPALIAVVVYLLWKYRQWLMTIGSVVASLVFVNLPTLGFELRHGFFLTRLLLTGEKLGQGNLAFQTKVGQLIDHGLLVTVPLGILLILLVIVAVGVSLGWKNTQAKQPLAVVSSLLWGTLVISFIAPFGFASHYVFPFVTLLIVTLTLLPYRFMVPVGLIFGSIWLSPSHIASYFAPAPRTASETLSCARTVCSAEIAPFYVSAQGRHYPSRSGVEFQYAFKEAGCTVLNLDTQPGQANRMAVVADDAVYEHGLTRYNELTQFDGYNAVVDSVYTCSDKLSVLMLQK